MTASNREFFERVYPLLRKTSVHAPQDEIDRERSMLFESMYPDPDVQAEKLQESVEALARATTLEAKLDKTIDELVSWRDTLRADKDWKQADKIRDLLAKNGVQIKDGVKGKSTWDWKT